MEHLVRIYGNIQALLLEGSFPGKFGGAIAEALALVNSTLTQLEQDLGKETGSDGSSVGNAPDAAGVASSSIQPVKRKGRGRKGN